VREYPNRKDKRYEKRGQNMSEPTKEYWQAKAQLCEKLAMDQLLQADAPNAMKNLERMVYALSRVEGFNNE
jgi:hypothetical protein